MNNKNYKPELLAPAGEIKSVYGAFYAGADAVYLGAPMFSARAYAVNLSIDDICEAVRYAHLFGKKVHLALNTLLKNSELVDALNEIKPLYEAGLDAVIVQDLGLICLLKTYYPDLELHVSTQEAVMSVEAVRYLKQYGITRVVPARELSLEELKILKEENIEVECFIHGAMCYAYSGKCLFSSLAGGRSGNRGRCAGTCRKAYDTYFDGVKINNDTDRYPLSMRDMCCINEIPELIDAEIDSFKIEGRMKAPEYAAGVSALYSKAIDEYINKGIKPARDIEKKLRKLYMRADVSTGYLHRHNGPQMISLESPSYSGISEEDTALLAEKYLDKKHKIQVNFYLSAHKNEALYLCGYAGDAVAEGYGPVCEQAMKRPTDEVTFTKQLKKMGDTFFEAGELTLDIDNDIFVVVSAINEIRRQVVNDLLNQLVITRTSQNIPEIRTGDCFEAVADDTFKYGVKTELQLKKLLEYSFAASVIVDLDLAVKIPYYSEKLKGKKVYLRLPSVIRQNRLSYVRNRIKQVLDIYDFAGIYAQSLDGLNIARDFFEKDKIYTEDGIYVFNDTAASSVLKNAARFTLSHEFNQADIRSLGFEKNREMVVYGHAPLMYTAGCVQHTFGKCLPKEQHDTVIQDEAGRRYVVLAEHGLCYNVIYNNVPLSLIARLDDIMKEGMAASYRFEFTVENEAEMGFVLDMVREALEKNDFSDARFPANTFTAGHFQRGVV